MDSPIVKATLQSAVLSAVSNVLGQCISCYQADRPFSINTVELFHFALFSLLACPPNYIWQSWLENTFPGYTEKTPEQKLKRDGTDVAWSSESSETKDGGNTSTDLRQRANEALSDASSASNPLSEKRSTDTKSGKVLNIKNTAIKFALDQTLGAAFNTVAFIAGIALLRGEDIESVTHKVSKDFLPMIMAGQKLWPAYSLISFTLIPVEHRMVAGAIVGVFWGIILTLLSGGKK